MAPALETARLRLRGWIDADVEPWAAMNADPRVMEFFVEPTPPERSRDQARLMRADLEAKGYGWFVMEILERPGFAGVIAIDDIGWETPFAPRREIGWRLPVEAWGNGYATEAAAAAMEYAFATLGWRHIVAMTSVLNQRSMRVMERLGMTHGENDVFEHPRVPEGHRVRLHTLYRKSAAGVDECPQCGSARIVPVMYGFPAPEGFEAAKRGEVALGGCIVAPANPSRECTECATRF